MRIRDAFGIYHVLETRLRSSAAPMTCVELYDDSDVRKFADSVSRVSDYLGHMFRQGLLGRETAAKSPNSQARYAYFWKNKSEMTIAAPKPAALAPVEPLPGVVRTVLKKPTIEISENGGVVVIDLPQLSITIRAK